MGNPGLDESQAGIKISWENINSLRYADDATLRAEGEKWSNDRFYFGRLQNHCGW